MAKRFQDELRYNAKYRSKLLPCKCCGGDDIHICTGRTTFNPQNVWYVMCNSCLDCTNDFTSVRAAIAHWNSKEFRDDAR